MHRIATNGHQADTKRTQQMANIANIITYTTCVRQRLFPKGKQRATAVQPSAMVKAVAIAAVPPSSASPSSSLHLQARLSLSRSLVIDELLRIWSINAFLSFFRSGKFMA